MMLRRNFKYRLYPTPTQDALLRRWESVLRFLWNLCQEQRLAGLARPKEERVYLSHYEQCRQLTELLDAAPWIADVQCQARQEIVADLDKAWSRCFNGLARAPHWKRHGDAMRIFAPTATVKYDLVGDRKAGALAFAGPRYRPLGTLKIVLDRPTRGAVKSWSIKRDGDEWYATASCEIEVAEPVRVNDKAVGVDRGVALLLADSDGHKVPNVRARGALEDRIVRAQRQVDHKKRGSNNQKKARARVAKLLRRAARTREVAVNTASLRYAKSYGTVVIEKLAIGNMTASATGTVDHPGKQVAQKSGLNRAILDAGWGKFAEGLKYKVAERGGTVIEVSPSYTSQTCPGCGCVDATNRPTQSEFRCISCSYAGNADVVAAQNILTRGLAAPTPTPKTVIKTFRRGRKPKTSETAVKPTAKQPAEDSGTSRTDEAGTGDREVAHRKHERASYGKLQSFTYVRGALDWGGL